MSSTIKQAIEALKSRVADAYTAIVAKGGTLPATQDSANLPSAIASIPSGGAQEPLPKDINFFDHRSMVASYTLAEIQDLTELPTPKEYDHLTFVRWTHSLADVKDGKYHEVGALYKTSDDSFRIGISILDNGRYFDFVGIQGTGVVVDWGDGSTSQGLNVSHVYAENGEYEIKITGVLNLGITNLKDEVARKIIYIETPETITNYDFTRGVGSGVGTYQELRWLQLAPSASNVRLYEGYMTCKYLVVPSNISQILIVQRCLCERMAIENGVQLFSVTQANALQTLYLPDSITTMSGTPFYSLQCIRLGNSLTTLANNIFQNAKFSELFIPSSVTSLGVYSLAVTNTYPTKVYTIEGTPSIGVAWWGCGGAIEVHFLSTTPPTLVGGTAFATNYQKIKAYIPSGSRAAYEADTNWAANIAANYVELIEE